MGVPGAGRGDGLAAVFFMADVSELRMELIFPRSTFARLTPRGFAEALGALAEVGVTGAAVAATAALAFEAFVGVVGSFDAGSDLVVLATAEVTLSLLSSPASVESTSSSDMSMSSGSLLSLGSPSSMAFPSSSGSSWALPAPRPKKGESEPVGDGASSEGEGMGESSGPGRVDLRESNFLFRLATRLAKALYALATILTSLYCIS